MTRGGPWKLITDCFFLIDFTRRKSRNGLIGWLVAWYIGWLVEWLVCLSLCHVHPIYSYTRCRWLDWKDSLVVFWQRSYSALILLHFSAKKTPSLSQLVLHHKFRCIYTCMHPYMHAQVCTLNVSNHICITVLSIVSGIINLYFSMVS